MYRVQFAPEAEAQLVALYFISPRLHLRKLPAVIPTQSFSSARI